MQAVVSITSQGQISIPASIRRALGLDRYTKALVSVEDKKVVIEPVSDFFSLFGSVKGKNRYDSQKARANFIKYLSERKAK